MKAMITHLVKNLAAFYGTLRLITLFVRAIRTFNFTYIGVLMFSTKDTVKPKVLLHIKYDPNFSTNTVT
jgi:hypothetical protein